MSIFGSRRKAESIGRDKSASVSAVLLAAIILPLVIAVAVYSYKACSSQKQNADKSTAAQIEDSVWLDDNDFFDRLKSSNKFSIEQVNESECRITTESLGEACINAENKNNKLSIKLEFEYVLTDISAFMDKHDPVAEHMQAYAAEEATKKTDEAVSLIAEALYAANGYELTYSDELNLCGLIETAYGGKMSEITLGDNNKNFEVSILMRGTHMCIAIAPAEK